MKEILLSQNRYAIVDDCNYEIVNKFKWHYSLGYAKRWDYSKGKHNPIGIFMHRFITGDVPLGLEIDHINGNKLDNRRENLRVCKHSDNVKNANKRINSKSIHKGVAWNTRMKRWQVAIQHDKKRYFIGTFKDEKLAAIAYNLKAKELHGDFAKLNVID